MSSASQNAAKIEAAYEFHRISRERLKDIQHLYKEVFGKDMPLDFFIKKYDTAYTGIENIGYIAYHKETGEVAATTALIPVVFRFRDQIIIGGHSGDSATSNNHQKKGLYSYLLMKGEELAIQEGVQFFWGFANQNSVGPAVKSLGLTNNEKMNCYHFSIPAIPVEALCRKIPFLQNLYQRYVSFVLNCFFKPADRLPDNFVLDNRCGTMRNEAYRLYKKLDHSSVWKLGNTIVWLKVQGGMQVGDVEAADFNQLKKMVQRLKWIAFLVGTHKMFFHFSPRLPINAWMEKLCPKTQSWPICFKDYTTGLPLEELNFTYADLDNF